jgi:hypothetical protein
MQITFPLNRILNMGGLTDDARHWELRGEVGVGEGVGWGLHFDDADDLFGKLFHIR